jgi:Leucine-rich repeat (LRR) protein
LEDGTFSAIKIPLLQNRFGAYGRRGFSSLTLHKNDEQQAKKKTLEGPMPTDSTKDKDGTRNESDLQASQGTSLMTQEMKVEVIDLSNNKISELPKSIFTLARLKYLFISGTTNEIYTHSLQYLIPILHFFNSRICDMNDMMRGKQKI